jgi:hypothetical protein
MEGQLRVQVRNPNQLKLRRERELPGRACRAPIKGALAISVAHNVPHLKVLTTERGA